MVGWIAISGIARFAWATVTTVFGINVRDLNSAQSINCRCQRGATSVMRVFRNYALVMRCLITHIFALSANCLYLVCRLAWKRFCFFGFFLSCWFVCCFLSFCGGLFVVVFGCV